jgi:hypothetical protein
MALEN